MRTVGFIFLGFDPKVSEKIVLKTKEIMNDGLNLKIYTNKGSQEDEYVKHTVESALEECDKSLFFIDAKDEGNLSRSFEIGVKTMYEEAEEPTYVITNFKGLTFEELCECKNIVGNILYNNGWVDYDDVINYKTVFFSPEEEIAFEDVVYCEIATDAEAYANLFRN